MLTSLSSREGSTNCKTMRHSGAIFHVSNMVPLSSANKGPVPVCGGEGVEGGVGWGGSSHLATQPPSHTATQPPGHLAKHLKLSMGGRGVILHFKRGHTT